MWVGANDGEEVILLEEGLTGALVVLDVFVGIRVNRFGYNIITRYLKIL